MEQHCGPVRTSRREHRDSRDKLQARVCFRLSGSQEAKAPPRKKSPGARQPPGDTCRAQSQVPQAQEGSSMARRDRARFAGRWPCPEQSQRGRMRRGRGAWPKAEVTPDATAQSQRWPEPPKASPSWADTMQGAEEREGAHDTRQGPLTLPDEPSGPGHAHQSCLFVGSVLTPHCSGGGTQGRAGGGGCRARCLGHKPAAGPYSQRPWFSNPHAPRGHRKTKSRRG